MGIGDELMAAGRAEAMWRANGLRVKILDRHDRPRWHPVWDGNPAIARPEEPGPCQTLKDCSYHRPYVREIRSTQWWWKPYAPLPATIVLTEHEVKFARAAVPPGVVVLEPTIKPKASPNKDWGWPRWRRLVELLQASGAGLAGGLVQLGPAGTRTLPGVRLIETPDFRQAAAVLARARAFVGHEGALHHAAAALNIPAVVIFGGFISPQVTGYAGQVGLFRKGSGQTDLGCGRKVACDHCAAAMAAIMPEAVAAELRNILQANADGFGVAAVGASGRLK